ncbi:MAG: hypothetical protein Q4G03_02345 [Planctomycetia bacterium]|nr:hypothetical protein [Planctomycetia bacterium]
MDNQQSHEHGDSLTQLLQAIHADTTSDGLSLAVRLQQAFPQVDLSIIVALVQAERAKTQPQAPTPPQAPVQPPSPNATQFPPTQYPPETAQYGAPYAQNPIYPPAQNYPYPNPDQSYYSPNSVPYGYQNPYANPGAQGYCPPQTQAPQQPYSAPLPTQTVPQTQPVQSAPVAPVSPQQPYSAPLPTQPVPQTQPVQSAPFAPVSPQQPYSAPLPTQPVPQTQPVQSAPSAPVSPQQPYATTTPVANVAPEPAPVIKPAPLPPPRRAQSAELPSSDPKSRKKTKGKKNKTKTRAPQTKEEIEERRYADELNYALYGAADAEPDVDPELFLASVNLNEEPDAENALNTLTAADAATQKDPDEFLDNLSKTDKDEHQNESAATTLAMIQQKDALERAVNDAPMWLSSLFLHLMLVLLLALIFTKVDSKKFIQIVSEPGFGDKVVLDEVFDPDAMQDVNIDDQFEVDQADIQVDSDVVAEAPDLSNFAEDTAAALTLTEDSLGLDSAPLGDLENLMGSLNGDDLSGRGENKAAALITGGGNEGSEKSVALALSWLAEHQLPNGSWSFNLRACPSCGGACTHSGSNSSVIAATSMGLLPFLAAGNTPTQGKYKKVVKDGVNYLLELGQDTEHGLSFRDDAGNMYAHGLATITLCETYAMLSPKEKQRYRELGYLAQSAINFIEYAQADDGGWRYTPKQAGDTSVFGWQMMALKSAQLAGLSVNDMTVRDARNFLRDVVSFEYETRYNYQRGTSESNATTSVGLLCRLYLDWRTDNATAIRGATRIGQIGPNFNNPYYTYYATQLMHNVGGKIWDQWNYVTRDHLINSQEMDGHARGSWFPTSPDGHANTGGRLYATSLNCMILEVYYRHMPLYQRMENGSQFPLDVPIEVKVEKTEPENADAKKEDEEKDEE